MILRNSKTNLKANFVFAHGKKILEEGLSIFMIRLNLSEKYVAH